MKNLNYLNEENSLTTLNEAKRRREMGRSQLAMREPSSCTLTQRWWWWWLSTSLCYYGQSRDASIILICACFKCSSICFFLLLILLFVICIIVIICSSFSPTNLQSLRNNSQKLWWEYRILFEWNLQMGKTEQKQAKKKNWTETKRMWKISASQPFFFLI